MRKPAAVVALTRARRVAVADGADARSRPLVALAVARCLGPSGARICSTRFIGAIGGRCIGTIGMVYPGTLFHRRQRGIPMHSYENRSQIRALILPGGSREGPEGAQSTRNTFSIRESLNLRMEEVGKRPRGASAPPLPRP
jgi:hypothetical protein